MLQRGDPPITHVLALSQLYWNEKDALPMLLPAALLLEKYAPANEAPGTSRRATSPDTEQVAGEPEKHLSFPPAAEALPDVIAKAARASAQIAIRRFTLIFPSF